MIPKHQFFDFWYHFFAKNNLCAAKIRKFSPKDVQPASKQMPDVESGKEFTDSNCRRACFPGPELQGSRPVLQPELLRPA